MAQRWGLGKSTTSRIWRVFGLQPHRTEMFNRSTNRLFIEKVRDITGLYLYSQDRALVLSADGNTQLKTEGDGR